jgi:putative aldouronate transport system permease protein
MVTKSRSLNDRVANGVVYTALVGVALISVFPILFVVSASLTPYGEVLRNGGYVILPREITLDAYRQILSDATLLRALWVTVFITVVGTALSMVLTTLIAYPLSRKDLPGRRYLLLGVLFALMFSAGIIPRFMIVQATGLLDTIWAMIIPSAVAVFNVLVMKTFFEGLPVELIEAARIDGAGEFRVLLRIVLPLSVPVMLALGLFYAVNRWNEFRQAILYIRDNDLLPLQVVIRYMLLASQSVENVDVIVPTVTMQMAAIVVAAVPMIAIYPFVQKHFRKAVLIGAVKG